MISVVMPTYNEEKALPGTLCSLFSQPGDYEVLIVDGGSDDRTRAIAESFGFIDAAGDRRYSSPVSCPSCCEIRVTNGASRRVFTAPKGRASQMNAGAEFAKGEWLLFLHADTTLPGGAIRRLNELEADRTVQAGGFMHRFSGDDWRLKLISTLDNFRCARSRIIYGDQALFVRRSLFERLGGFPKQRVLEDVAFCEKLINVTKPLLLSPPVVTDSRKFVQMGIWRSFARVLAIILHVEWGMPTLPSEFFRDIR